jgi:hypothetical protein
MLCEWLIPSGFTENIAKQAQSLLQPFVLRELDHDSGVQPMLARKELSALKEGELLNSRSVVVFGELVCLNREITWDVIC